MQQYSRDSIGYGRGLNRVQTLFVPSFIASLFFLVSSPLAARTWTSTEGRTIEAEFISADANNVKIRRSDGRTFDFPIIRLSQADQDFVRNQLKTMRAGRAIAGATGSRTPAVAPTLNIDTSKPWEIVNQNVKSALRRAREKEVENLLQPVHTTRYGSDENLIWAPNPDGKTWDVLPLYYNGYGGESTVPIFDLGSGEMIVNNYPRGTNWHLCPYVLAPNGKVYISVKRGRQVGICIYDPASNKMEIDAIEMPAMGGETHPIIRATDGMIFAGGSHSTQAASLVMINPIDDTVTDFGVCGPSHRPTSCYNYFIGADDTHVYIASGKVPWYLISVDRNTKESKVLAKTATNGGIVTVYQQTHGVVANVNAGPGAKKQQYWCYEGGLVPGSRPCPWKETGTDWEKKLPKKPEIYTERILPPEPDIEAEFWVKTKVPGRESDRKMPAWTAFKYNVPLYPMVSDRLIEIPDGRIFGTAGSYAGNYIYDPASGECTYQGKISLSHYSTAIHRNKIWMSGYPSSKLYVYDYTKPWNVLFQGEGPGSEKTQVESPKSNPQLAGRLGLSKCHKMYSAAVGASGDLYFGGRWMRTGNGGGLGWWDAKANEEKGGMWEEFSAQQITHMCAVDYGKRIVISTMAIRDIVLKKPTPPEGLLFVFDDAKKKITKEFAPIKGVKGPGPIAWAGGNRVIGWTNDPSDIGKSILYGADVEKGETVWKVSMDFKLPIVIGSNQEERWDFRIGPDGHIWTFMGDNARTLVRIDPQTAMVDAVVELEGPAGRIAFSGEDVYLSGTTSLRRIRGVVGNR